MTKFDEIRGKVDKFRSIFRSFLQKKNRKTSDNNGNPIYNTENASFSLCRTQATWSPTCAIKQPITWKRCSTWPKIVRFSGFYRKKNYRKDMGPRPRYRTLRKNVSGGCSKLHLLTKRKVLGEKKSKKNV